MKDNQQLMVEIYNRYSTMMYRIALKLTPTSSEAEKIISQIFQQIEAKNIVLPARPFLCMELIKLVIQAAEERLNANSDENYLSEQQLQHLSASCQLLWDANGLEDYCQENNLTSFEAGRKLREKFTSSDSHINENKFHHKHNVYSFHSN